MASYTETQIHCAMCQRHVLARRRVPNHVLHLLASVLLCGFWVPAWVIVTLSSEKEPWRCAVCGGTPEPAGAVATRRASPVGDVLGALGTNKPWHWAALLGVAGLAGIGLLVGKANPQSRVGRSVPDVSSETVANTLPLELGEGDGPGSVTVYPVSGTPRQLTMPAGTRIEQLMRKGTPPDGMVGPRRIRVTSGPSAGVVAWVSGTKVQAARER